MIRKAPIILFTYRRLPKETIESLLRNKEVKNSELFIYSDGYKNDVDKKDVLNVRKYLKTVVGFKKINIVERERNWGLANNIIDGVTKIINEYGKVIVLEDDLIVSNDFLGYMNEALEYYKNNKTIWSVSGYSPPLKCLENYKKDVYLSMRANSWGWATWKDRWNTIDWKIKDWDKFKRNKKAKKKFNLGGNDMFKMLELQMLGKIDSWAIVWCYNSFKYGKYTVYPRCSKIKNIGFDNKSTHSFIGFNKWNVELCEEKLKLEHVEVNEYILNCFKNYYDINVIGCLGFLLKKYGGYNFIKSILKFIKKIM